MKRKFTIGIATVLGGAIGVTIGNLIARTTLGYGILMFLAFAGICFFGAITVSLLVDMESDDPDYPERTFPRPSQFDKTYED